MNTEELAITVVRHSERLEILEQRQARLDELVAAMSAMQTEQQHIKQDVGEIRRDVRALAALPASRWNRLTEAVITAAVGILLGILLRGL